ncbi:MFS transporter [Nocardioides daeguensis]|uniref:MFS transporter n=1 Tax=Nocardioides daeguensis TaxID=908359 RepID=A0ABP6VYS3_9ACTN|nr:MFS transporter [Nocardioides daeguensis]
MATTDPYPRSSWAVLAAFAVVGAVTQLLWLTYAPVTTAAAEHYGVSEAAIGWLANVFPLWYVVLAIPTGLALDRWLRPTLAVGAVLTALGACVRLAGDDFGTALAGQTLIAVAQPLVVTATSAVPARYLRAADRPRGIAAASASTFAGMILAFLLGTVVSLHTTLVVGAVVAVAAAGVLLVVLREAPGFVPELPAAGVVDFLAAWRNPVVRRMCLLVPIPFGTFTALTTWGQPLLEPAGVSSDQAGLLLLLNVAAGVVGCAVVPVWAAERGRQHQAVLAGVLAAVAGCLVLAALPGAGSGLVVFVMVGVLLLPALPIVLELSERASGPSAGAAAGLVWMAGQLGALVVTGLAGLLVDAPAAAFVFLAAVTLLALPALPLASRSSTSRPASSATSSR